MKIKAILSAIALVAISSSTFAQEATEMQKVNPNKTQKERIKQGVKSGEITKKEKAKIEVQRQETKAAVKDAKSDGVVTPEEKAEIEKQRKQASNTIYRKKHNKVKN